MTRPRIGFIGAGNMGRSLAGGLIRNGWSADNLIMADPDAGQRDAVTAALGIPCCAPNRDVAEVADVLVLAIKPQNLRAVTNELAAPVQQRHPLVLSVVAGVREPDIQRWLGGGLAIVRAMPNTPALVGSGATGLFANSLTSAAQRDQAESILRAVGITVWLEQEEQLDLVTALSGSGPAYFLLIMESLERAAVEAGLPAGTARLLTLETAFGTAKMALESQEDPARLRQRVTSPGGTTERAIEVLTAAGLPAIMARALDAAAARSRELAALLGQD